jgi:predicted phage terminase large subunit-like protein
MKKPLTPAQAANHLLTLHKASESFLGFVRLIYPKWTLAPFQQHLIETLNTLEQDTMTTNNILITMPPRHAKSTFGTVLFPSYFMAKDPTRYIMSCSYNAQLATDFGRQVRTVVEDPLVHQAFPDFKLSQESRAADVWRTESGGAYFSVGIGGTTSGRPANLLIVDDPIKSREDAESMTQRNKTWNYYTSALSTRLQPQATDNRPSKTIVILTRWHPDDLAGRLIETEDWNESLWTHINLPAYSTKVIKGQRTLLRHKLPKDHPEYLTHAEQKLAPSDKKRAYPEEEIPLWPERFPLDELKRRERLNPREFASLYQQQPYIEGGNLIRTEWWQYYPDDLRPTRFQTLIIAADTAFKKTETADYSVAITAGIDTNGDIYIIDIMRGKYDFPELKQRLIHLNNRYRGKGLRAVYIEDKASGQSLIQELKRQSGISVIPYKVVHDKVARVNSILPIIEGGRVFLPQSSSWLDDFIDETVSFPAAAHDDQVDAMTMAIDILSRTSVSTDDWLMHPDASQSLNNTYNDKDNPLGKSLSSVTKKSSWKGWGI